jgi:hypothetical protein
LKEEGSLDKNWRNDLFWMTYVSTLKGHKSEGERKQASEKRKKKKKCKKKKEKKKHAFQDLKKGSE